MNLRNLSPFLASIALSSLCIPQLFAQSAPEGRKWVVQNPKSIELTVSGIHFLSHDVKSRPSSTTTEIHLADGKPWIVAFEFQLGPTLAWAMSIHLKQGKNDVAWLGADDYYKQLSAFIGSGTSNMPLTQPWDTNWHRFEYRSDGKILSLWHNGVKCGEGIQTGTPDSLQIGSDQLEMRVRKVLTRTISNMRTSHNDVGNLPQPDKISAFEMLDKSPIAKSRYSLDNSSATIIETRKWICSTINRNAGSLYQDGRYEQAYSNANFEGNTLMYSNVDAFYNLTVYNEFQVPLEKMDENKITTTQIDPVNDRDVVSYRVTMSTLNDAFAITHKGRMYTESQPDLPYKQSSKTSCFITFMEEKMAERFAKAIRHAILISKTNHVLEAF